MSKKILIIDDEEGIRESLKLILEDNYDIILAENPAQGIDIIEKSKDVSLILIDIKMPKMNGLEALKQIKEKRPDIKVIFVTGYKSVETASEAAHLGANGYITKPFKPAEILEAVKKNF